MNVNDLLNMMPKEIREEIEYRVSIFECEHETECPEGNCPDLGLTIANVLTALADFENHAEHYAKDKDSSLQDAGAARKTLKSIYAIGVRLGKYRVVSDHEYDNAVIIPARAKSQTYFKLEGIRYTFDKHPTAESVEALEGK